MDLKNLRGKTINGRYYLKEILPAGGMGVVYRALDRGTTRQLEKDIEVVIKFLLENRLEEAKKRFRAEAAVLLQLQHQHICAIQDIAEWVPPEGDASFPFIVMKYYDGRDLSKVLREDGPLELARVKKIAIQTTLGLQYLHKKNIYHRDLKPANIMVRDDDEVVILDFGLVKHAAGQALTDSQQRMGTPFYMSPEQVEGAEIDHRTDIWSMGVVLYEMLTGFRPFGSHRDSPAQIMYRIMRDQPELDQVEPSDWRAVVERTLQKDPEDRFFDADELLDSLRGLSTVPSTTEFGTMTMPGSDAKRTRRDRPSPPRGWLRYLTVFGAILALTVVVLWQLPSRSEDPADELKARALESIAHGDRDGGILFWLQAIRQGDRKGWLQHARGTIGADYQRLVATFRHHTPRVCALAFSADGQRIATGSLDGEGQVRLWRGDGNGLVGPDISHGGAVWSLAFGADDQSVVTAGSDREFSTQGAAKVWPSGASAPIFEVSGSTTVGLVRNSADGRLLLTAEQFSARLWEVASRREVASMVHGGRVLEAWFQENAAMTLDQDGRLQRWTGTKPDLRGELGEILAAAVSADGRRVAVVNRNPGNVKIWSLDGEQPEELATLPVRDVNSLAISATGDLVLVGGSLGVARLWHAGGEPAGPPLRHSTNVCAVALTADGTMSLTGTEGGLARLWRNEPEDVPAGSMKHASAVTAVALHPDSDRLLTGSAAGSLTYWEIGRPQSLMSSLQLHEDSITGVTFLGDNLAVSGGKDAKIRQMNLSTGAIRTHEEFNRRAILVVVPGPQNRVLATGGRDGFARIWGESGPSATGKMPHDNSVTAIAFSRDGDRIATGTDLGEVQIWDWAEGEEELDGPLLLDNGNEVTALTFGGAQKREMLAVGDLQGNVYVRVAGQMEFTTKIRHQQRVETLVMVPGDDFDQILVVATHYWLHTYSIDKRGNVHPRANCLLPGAWTGGFRFVDPPHNKRLTVILGGSDDTLFAETLYLFQSGNNGPRGLSTDSYDDWARRLALRWDKESGNFTPALH